MSLDAERGNTTILLADDEECLLMFTRIVLVEMGYNVLSARTAEEALMHVQSHAGNIDLLLTDMRMPTMGGERLSLEFRKVNPTSKVVYMTAYPPEEMVLRFPSETILYKPFSPNLLCETIKGSLAFCA